MLRFVLSLTLLLIASSCSSPDEPALPQPVKTNFNWKLDTIRYLNASQLFFSDIYGTDDGTVYATAFCNNDTDGTLWKYTKGVWEDVKINEKYGGPLQGVVFQLHSIDGNGRDKVWMVGARIRFENYRGVFYGFLASYDGQQFYEVNLFNEPEILSIKVLNDNNIYFGGMSDTLYHYNGVRIDKEPLPMDKVAELSVHPISMVQVTNIEGTADEIVVGVNLDYDSYGGGRVQLTFGPNNEWSIGAYSTDANRFDIGGIPGLWTSPGGIIYSGGYGIFKYERPLWNQIATTVGKVWNIFGTSDRNIWGVGSLNFIAHGVDGLWETVPVRLPDAARHIDWINGWTNGDEVFIIGEPWNEHNIGVIAHGR